MNYSEEFLERIRSVDLLTYLEQTSPSELITRGRRSYSLRSHNSLKISNGKWFWFSRGFGGASALDYLTKVENMPFADAVNAIKELAPLNICSQKETACNQTKAVLELPAKNNNNKRVIAYLLARGVDCEIINHSIKHGILFEECEHHNAIFVGKDVSGNAAYAFARSTLSRSDFKIELSGSDARYSFFMGDALTGNLSIFESAIDALSYASLEKLSGKNWRMGSYLSLGGIGFPKNEPGETIKSASFDDLPQALRGYMSRFPVNSINICFDNDYPGRCAAESLSKTLSSLKISCTIKHPEQGKDFNEMLITVKSNQKTINQTFQPSLI